jgi:hypothetical protein
MFLCYHWLLLITVDCAIFLLGGILYDAIFYPCMWKTNWAVRCWLNSFSFIGEVEMTNDLHNVKYTINLGPA